MDEIDDLEDSVVEEIIKVLEQKSAGRKRSVNSNLLSVSQSTTNLGNSRC